MFDQNSKQKPFFSHRVFAKSSEVFFFIILISQYTETKLYVLVIDSSLPDIYILL